MGSMPHFWLLENVKQLWPLHHLGLATPDDATIPVAAILTLVNLDHHQLQLAVDFIIASHLQ